MTQTEQKIMDILLDIQSKVSNMSAKVQNDYLALHGNGKPGLLKEVEELTKRVVAIEVKDSTNHTAAGKVAVILGWLITTIIALAALFKPIV